MKFETHPIRFGFFYTLEFDRTQDKLRNAQMKFIEFEFDLCRIELDIFRSFDFFRGDNNFQPLALIID